MRANGELTVDVSRNRSGDLENDWDYFLHHCSRIVAVDRPNSSEIEKTKGETAVVDVAEDCLVRRVDSLAVER